MSNQEIIDKHLAEFHETHGLKVPIELHSYLHRMIEDAIKSRIRKDADEFVKVNFPKNEKHCVVCGARNCKNNETCIECNCPFL